MSMRHIFDCAPLPPARRPFGREEGIFLLITQHFSLTAHTHPFAPKPGALGTPVHAARERAGLLPAAPNGAAFQSGIGLKWLPFASRKSRGDRCPGRRGGFILWLAGSSRSGERRGRGSDRAAACPARPVDAAHDGAAPEPGPDISCAAVSHPAFHLHSAGEKVESGTREIPDRNCATFSDHSGNIGKGYRLNRSFLSIHRSESLQTKLRMFRLALLSDF